MTKWISRASVLRIIDAEPVYSDVINEKTYMASQINDLPTKEETSRPTQRPHGEWIWKKDEDALRTYDLLCSECGCKIFTCENYDNVEQAKKVVDDRIREGKTLYPFCPCCGSDNRKRGEAE